MGNVVAFTGEVVKDESPDAVLEQYKGLCSEVIVIGVLAADRKLIVHGSNGYAPDMLWLIEGAKRLIHGAAAE